MGISKIKYAFIFAIQLLGVAWRLELVFSDSGCTLTTLPHWDIRAESRKKWCYY